MYGCQMNEGDAEVVHSVLTKGPLTYDVRIGWVSKEKHIREC